MSNDAEMGNVRIDSEIHIDTEANGEGGEMVERAEHSGNGRLRERRRDTDVNGEGG